jgi:DNA-damage-inducible protein D
MPDPTNDQTQQNTTNDQQAKFESIKQVNPYGMEYWSARELAPLLGYDSWRRFEDAVDRAKAACRNAGQDETDHFAGAVKKAIIGNKNERQIDDVILSRFGCYLVAMNGDPRKPEIAAAQAYFAVQTRRAEQWQELREAQEERLHLRIELSDANKALTAVAQEHGVKSRSFGRLYNAGARGLYGERTVNEVKAYKGIGENEELDDRIGRAELAANLFVRTQTTEKIRNEQIHGQEPVIQAHYDVGSETRDLIARIGGTLPEDLPPEPSIRPLLDQHQRQQHKQRQLAQQQGGPTLFDALAAPDEPGEPDDTGE